VQVPQYVLEEAWGSGRAARIMCIQPRRISAMSVAERVAQARRLCRCIIYGIFTLPSMLAVLLALKILMPRGVHAVLRVNHAALWLAQERGETIGDTVGYSIRLETRGGPHSSVMFCTNGVLLRMLTQGETLQVGTAAYRFYSVIARWYTPHMS